MKGLKVIDLPKNYLVLDLGNGPDPRSKREMWTVGRYNEKRLNMYLASQYLADNKNDERNIHMGIDIGCPVGTPLYAFQDGEIYMFGFDDQPQSYGATLITRHNLDSKEIYVLYGHLSKKSIQNKKPGDKVFAGDTIAWVGDESENGGWFPHLHFQLSYKKPESCDIPGVVSQNQLEEALKIYPDPRTILGNIY